MRNKILSVALLFLTLSVQAQTAEQVDEVNRLLQLAVQNYQEKNYKEGLAFIEQALAVLPEDTTLLQNAGIYFAPAAEETNRAIIYIRKYLDRGGQNQDAFVQLFTLYRDKLNNLDQALVVAQEAMLRYPNNIDFTKYAVDIYIKQYRYYESKALLGRVVSTYPREKEMRYYMGLVCNELKQYDEAKFWLNEAIKIDPAYHEAEQALAELNNLPESSATTTEKPAANSTYVEKGPRVALVIGNSAYPNAPLRNASNDAQLVSTELKKLGFKVTTVDNASQNQIRKAISEFGTALAANSHSIGLFYYAGHGIQAKGKNYLVPVDAQIEKEPDVDVYCVDLEGLLRNLEYASNTMNLIILDACRNNPFGRSFRSQAGSGLATINAPSGTMIAFATSPGSTASDGEGTNGLYTQELIRAMQTPNLQIEDVFKKVRTQVRILSSGQQIPWENSALEGDFYFRKN